MSTNITNPADIYGAKTGLSTSTAIKGKGANEMGMDEFFSLLTAQMTNQDMMNPEGNTEFIAQMAQFSSLQGVKTIQEYQLSNYAVSYTGKNVTIANVNASSGELETITGVVDSVTFYDGKPQVMVNGKPYDLHTVMQVNAPDNTGNTLNQVASYIGKQVTLAAPGVDGAMNNVTGIVESVTLTSGKPYVTVGGVDYPSSFITNVQQAGAKAPETDTTTDTKTDTKTDTDTTTDTTTETDTDTDDETETTA